MTLSESIYQNGLVKQIINTDKYFYYTYFLSLKLYQHIHVFIFLQCKQNIIQITQNIQKMSIYLKIINYKYIQIFSSDLFIVHSQYNY